MDAGAVDRTTVLSPDDGDSASTTGESLSPASLRHFDSLRREPMSRTDDGRGWLTARHDVASAVLRDTRFSSRLEAAAEPSSILLMDPPDHTRLRRLVTQAFTPGVVAPLEPWIRTRAMSLLDARDGDDFDLVESFAEPLPLGVICHILGLEHDDAAHFSAWGRGLVSFMQGGVPKAPQPHQDDGSVRDLNEFMEQLVGARRRAPGGDILSKLALAEDDSDRMTHAELTTMCITLLIAGFVTTQNLINNAVLALIHNPEESGRLRKTPGLLANAVEEFLRYDGGMPATARRATVDVELGGSVIRRGERVVVLIAAANRDPSVFDEPDRLDVARANASRHLTFGGGIHYCLGAPLARLESRIALEVLLERFGRIELAATPERSAEGPNGWVERLPVRVRA